MDSDVWFVLFILLFILCVFVAYILRREPIETASGAIVMAFGIFLNGAAYRYPSMEPWWPVLSLCLFLIWLFIAASFLRLVPQKELKSKHLKDPVQSFAAGTWIAGTSVCGTVMIKHLSTWEWLVHGMAWFALFLWGYYIVLSTRNFYKIIHSELSRKVHGVVLLSTVSTQSLVILFQTLYGESIPLWIQSGMIMMGTGFYFLGFYLIMKRFIRIGSWNIVDEWPNTNCILHGAMSITGLASTVTKAVSPDLILVIWLWVLL